MTPACTSVRRFAATAVALVCLAAMALAQTAPGAQTVKPRVRVDPETGLPPGMPDFRGVWTNRWIVNMADGRYVEKTIDVPLNDKGRAIYAARTANLQKDDPNMTCKPSGLPRQGGTPYPLKIMQRLHSHLTASGRAGVPLARSAVPGRVRGNA